MARATVIFDSMTTPEVRAAIVALRHELQIATPTPVGEYVKQGTIGVNGPEMWTYTTPPITPAQAAMVCHAVAAGAFSTSAGWLAVRRDALDAFRNSAEYLDAAFKASPAILANTVRIMNMNDGSDSEDHLERDDCAELGCEPVDGEA